MLLRSGLVVGLSNQNQLRPARGEQVSGEPPGTDVGPVGQNEEAEATMIGAEVLAGVASLTKK